MSRSSLALVETQPAPAAVGDRVSHAMQQLRARLPSRTDSAVLMDLLEDDVREGLDALQALEEHYELLLDALEATRSRPAHLLEAADDRRALSAVDQLLDSLQRVRRRVAHAAARVRG